MYVYCAILLISTKVLAEPPAWQLASNNMEVYLLACEWEYVELVCVRAY